MSHDEVREQREKLLKEARAWADILERGSPGWLRFAQEGAPLLRALAAHVPPVGAGPVPMTQTELAEVLVDMAGRVGQGDSFEGSISYEMPYDAEDVPEDCYALVRASYRIGNTMGQGGVRLINADTVKGDGEAQGN